MTEIEKLQKQLDKIERKLEKHRAECADIHGNGTMRKARHERNWDYYAQEKFRIKCLIEDLQNT